MKRLLANQNLLRLLTYTDKEPLSADKPDISSADAYLKGDDGVVRIIPLISSKENSTSIVTMRILKGIPNRSNPEFLDIYFTIEVFVPNKQWIIKDENLRPFAIMSEIQKSLDNKNINGLGTIRGSGFSGQFFTEEISAFIMNYSITQFS
jgi:hypothetical protein